MRNHKLVNRESMPANRSGSCMFPCTTVDGLDAVKKSCEADHLDAGLARSSGVEMNERRRQKQVKD